MPGWSASVGLVIVASSKAGSGFLCRRVEGDGKVARAVGQRWATLPPVIAILTCKTVTSDNLRRLRQEDCFEFKISPSKH